MIRLGLIIAACSLAAPALAQRGIIWSEEVEASKKEARKLAYEYGLCVVKRQHALAAEAIRNNVDNATLFKRYNKLIEPRCLTSGTSEARFVMDQYRYALADALFRRDLAALPAPLLTSVPALDHRDPGQLPSPVSESGKPISAKKHKEKLDGHRAAVASSLLSRYGECVVRTNPNAARALLLTQPETAEERAQFASLGKALGACLPNGQTVRLGTLALRGAIAINYYRLAVAAVPGIVSAGAVK
jgi:hypothetical protein